MNGSHNRFREAARPGKFQQRDRNGKVTKEGFVRGETQALSVATRIICAAIASGEIPLAELEPTHLNRAYHAGKRLCTIDGEAVEESYRKQN